MIENTTPQTTNRIGMAAATAGVVTACATGAACIGPFVGIVFGIGGLGWLAQYAYLRVPAALATLLVLAVGFILVRRAGRGQACDRALRPARRMLWLAAALALAINTFEFVILPTLG
jgi:hypothetical protein